MTLKWLQRRSWDAVFRKRVPGVGSGNRKSSAADGSQSDWRHDQTVSSGRTQSSSTRDINSRGERLQIPWCVAVEDSAILNWIRSGTRSQRKQVNMIMNKWVWTNSDKFKYRESIGLKLLGERWQNKITYCVEIYRGLMKYRKKCTQEWIAMNALTQRWTWVHFSSPKPTQPINLWTQPNPSFTHLCEMQTPAL